MELIEKSQNENTYRRAAKSLGKIDASNEKAIAALVTLVESTPDEDTRLTAAESLGQIGTGNEKAIAALVTLLESTTDEYTARQAAISLEKILLPNNFAQIVAALKDSLNDSQRFNDECYRVIWYCTQNMTYPAFYQAWHSPRQNKGYNLSVSKRHLQ